MRVRGFSRRLSKPLLFAGVSAGAYSFSSPRLPTPGCFGSSSLPNFSRATSFLSMATTTAATLPSWADLAESSAASPVGKALNEEVSLRNEGKGSASRENTLRKFGQQEEPDITLYRDHAGWCPYCQKMLLLVEEKQVPVKIGLVPMRSYGDKPREFMSKVPSGLLPALEVNGKIITESQVIMELLEKWHPESEGYKRMLPREDDEAGRNMYRRLAELERDLFRWWCTLVFRPDAPGPAGGSGNPFTRIMGGGDQPRMSAAMNGFLDCVRQVDKYLLSTKGPWFLDEHDYPTMIDFIYVSHVERMLASCAYWKGLNLRDPKWNLKGLNAWIDAFEKREPYLAFKSDYYTHVMDIPPQYGPGYDGGFVEDQQDFSRCINGRDGSWHLPLSHDDSVQPLYRGPPLPLVVLKAADLSPDGTGSYESCDPATMAATCRSMAAWKLSGNGANVANFAARGGPSGAKNMRKTFAAPLADPYAEADANVQPSVDAALRVVCLALGDVEDAQPSPDRADQLRAAVKADHTGGVVSSLAYLRDRVGVPRDLPLASARYLRAYLNWAIDQLV